MGCIRIFISLAKHDSAISASIAAVTGTNTSSGDHDRFCVTAAAVLVDMRVVRPAVAMVPSMEMASGAAAVKLATKAKIMKPPADPFNIVVVKPDFKED